MESSFYKDDESIKAESELKFSSVLPIIFNKGKLRPDHAML